MSLYNSSTYLQDLRTAIAATRDIESLCGQSVLITGATGLIGSFLVDLLLEYNKDGADINIYALGRNLNRLRERFDGAITDKLHFVEHDVNEKPVFDFSVDYVIHAASNAYPAAFANDPVGTILSNVIGTNYLLNFAKDHGVKRFLFVSSGEVYGQGDSALDAFPEEYSGYVDPTKARSCYPASKRAAETLCVSYANQYGLDTVIVRPCHTYGPNTTKSDNRASVQFVNSALAGEDIVMRSRGTQMRSYCYIADCGSALLTVLLKGKNCEAYNLANPAARVTIAGFAEAVAKATGRRVLFADEDVPKNQQTPITYAVLNSDKLCALGWEGQYSVENGVANTVKSLLDTQK